MGFSHSIQNEKTKISLDKHKITKTDIFNGKLKEKIEKKQNNISNNIDGLIENIRSKQKKLINNTNLDTKEYRGNTELLYDKLKNNTVQNFR